MKRITFLLLFTCIFSFSEHSIQSSKLTTRALLSNLKPKMLNPSIDLNTCEFKTADAFKKTATDPTALDLNTVYPEYMKILNWATKNNETPQFNKASFYKKYYDFELNQLKKIYNDSIAANTEKEEQLAKDVPKIEKEINTLFNMLSPSQIPNRKRKNSFSIYPNFSFEEKNGILRMALSNEIINYSEVKKIYSKISNELNTLQKKLTEKNISEEKKTEIKEKIEELQNDQQNLDGDIFDFTEGNISLDQFKKVYPWINKWLEEKQNKNFYTQLSKVMEHTKNVNNLDEEIQELCSTLIPKTLEHFKRQETLQALQQLKTPGKNIKLLLAQDEGTSSAVFLDCPTKTPTEKVILASIKLEEKKWLKTWCEKNCTNPLASRSFYRWLDCSVPILSSKYFQKPAPQSDNADTDEELSVEEARRMETETIQRQEAINNLLKDLGFDKCLETGDANTRV